MGWKEPDKDKDKNQWNGQNQPPDLDEALKRFQDKLKKPYWGEILVRKAIRVQAYLEKVLVCWHSWLYWLFSFFGRFQAFLLWIPPSRL